MVNAAMVSVPEKLSRWADPESMADSVEVAPLYPKSWSMKSRLSFTEPVTSR